MPLTLPRRLVAALLPLVLVAAACGSGAEGPSPDGAPGATMTPAAGPASPASPAPEPTAAPDTGGDTPPPALETPAGGGAAAALATRPWATADLLDVTTGDTFRIADFAGKVVFVETMAIWCTNCRAQQEQAVDAMAQLDRERVAWIVIDVDLSERAEDLAAYRERNGFDFTYAVATEEVARALRDEFGAVVLSPPSVPIVLIDSAGGVTFETGHKPATRILELAAASGA